MEIGGDIVVWWNGVIKVPADGGKLTDYPFEIQCRVLSDVDQTNKFILMGTEAQIGYLFDSIKDWKGFTDADGNELPFNRKNFEHAMNNRYVNAAIISTFAEASSGAAAKN